MGILAETEKGPEETVLYIPLMFAFLNSSASRGSHWFIGSQEEHQIATAQRMHMDVVRTDKQKIE